MEAYFHDWVSKRYSGSGIIPNNLYQAWEILRPTVYNNTNLTANSVPKSILELIPSTSGLVNRTGHHPTKLNYDPCIMTEAWNMLYTAGLQCPQLFLNPAYQYDLVDWTRQVLANAFIPIYTDLVNKYSASASTATLKAQGLKLTSLLSTLDRVLSTNKNFLLSTWLRAAIATAPADSASNTTLAAFLEYEARNQLTLWGPTGQITGYASKSWAGLVSSYYTPRWQMFIDYLLATEPAAYNQTSFNARLLEWELAWVNQSSVATEKRQVGAVSDIQNVIPGVLEEWQDLFSI